MVQIWGRHSTTVSNRIDYVVDVIWSTMLPLLVLHHWGITHTIQPKLRQENVNKYLIGEKCELLLLSALSFFSKREKYLELGIRYLHWLYRARSFVSHAKRSSKASEELRTLKRQQVPKNNPQGSKPITDPRKRQGRREWGRSRGCICQWGTSNVGPRP